jgi:signal transduction histidine kinase
MKTKSSNILIIALLALLYYATAEFRSQFILYSGIVSTVIFPSEGIALAFAIYFGKRVWPGIFIGQFLIAYSNGLDIPTSMAISAVNSIEAIIAVTLFQKLQLNQKLETFRDIIGLSMLILFVLQPFSALASNLFLLYFGHIEQGSFVSSVFSWWFGNVMGQFLYTPLFLALFNYYKEIKLQNFFIYNTLFAAYLIVLLYFFDISSSLLLLSITLPLLLYILYIKNTLFSLFMIVVTSYILSYFMAIGRGPFLYQDGTIHVIDYDLYLLTLILTILTAKIIFDNHKRQEEFLQKRIAQEVEKNKEQQFFMLHQSRLAQMGEMIAMIAHQWRQPLNNLSLLHQLVISKYNKNKLDDKMIEYFKKSSKIHVDMMSETINDFKNFFKPQESMQEFEINELVINILNMIKPSLQKEGIKIIFLTQSTYKYRGYKNSLGHAILNIINNAKDALAERDIKEKKIVIEISEQESDIIISIRDNAGGIAKDILDKIFDPYFSTKHEKNGTGLGLYMTRMIIVEHMHSTIKVYNSHEGAVFDIILQGDYCEKTE